MQRSTRKSQQTARRGSTLALVAFSLVILATLGVGLLAVAYGSRHEALVVKGEAAAMLAAEAGYEKAVFWMSRQNDMLTALQQGASGTSGSITFPDSSCNYSISLYTFSGSRPIFRVASEGRSGIFERHVDVLVLQAISGWDMGACRVPTGATSTTEVYFASGEVIDMPLYINKAEDSPDVRDIFITGSPQFLRPVAMGESRHTDGGTDKYATVMDRFDDGIHFDMPSNRVTDEGSVQAKVTRFRDSTNATYLLTPVASAALANGQPATQLEFFVEGGIGKVRITNHCTVRGFQQDENYKTYDFRVQAGSDGTRFERYPIYSYHVAPEDADGSGARFVAPLTDTYVTQSFDGTESDPGGQIFVDGNVVIGGSASTHDNDQVVKGAVTVVATGNIWIADSIRVDGNHDADGLPSADNPNVLGLIAQGVIRVVDPGLSTIDGISDPVDHDYVPVCRPDHSEAAPDAAEYYERHLPNPMVVEASITVGGGGWGAENVRRSSYGGRKETTGPQDDLVVRGTIAEVTRGVVGRIGDDGFLKSYYMDERLLSGIVPGNIWLRGKYVPAPAGWHDYRPGG